MKKISELKSLLAEGGLSSRFLTIYGSKDSFSYQESRYLKALDAFSETFGDGEVSLFSAPGRTEIGGNHTDHQHGRVLAASIHLDAIAVARPTAAPVIRLLSKGYDVVEVSITDLSIDENNFGTTASLIRGVCADFINRGFAVGGFEAYVTSDVLIGAGLSSSAAFEILLGTILSHFYNDGKVDSVTLAQIGQYAENVYFGKPCGLMDQMACSVGDLVAIDFANPKEPVVNQIANPLMDAGYCLCVTDTKGSHANLTPDYAAIPQEMCAAAKVLGKEFLGELSLDEVYANLNIIRQKVGDRATLRAIHFVEENNRVSEEADALRQKDIKSFLKLVNASGRSSFQFLQNVYTPQDLTHQNVSVALALSEHLLCGQGACRVHGGGFAGTMQAFVPQALVQDYKKGMESVFGPDACHILFIRPYGGIKLL
ncbi:MAG: galactokinase [Lachnospiraceae bacterium]|jgi:galactokinase|nr:galactokinase [Lachnospiraceae bacterium]